MKHFFSFLLCFFFLKAYSQDNILYYQRSPDSFAGSKFSRQSLKEDMEFWRKVMEESHVNPYHAISKKELVQLEKNVLDQLPDSVTLFEASFAISKLIGSLNEGHLGFASNSIIDSLYINDCIRFPYLLSEIDNDALVVQEDLSVEKRLSPFGRILAINNIPVKQLYEKYSRFYGGLEPWKKLMVKNNLRKLLYMDGITSPFTIRAISGKDTLQFVTEGYNKQQADSLTKVIAARMAPYQPFTLRFIENNIAFIEFNTMRGELRDSFSAFLRKSFAIIKEKGAKGIIIDLRRNGGGDNGLGDTLISYISGRHYRNAGGMKMRISKHSKAYYQLLGAPDPFANQKNGKLFEYNDIKLRTPVNRELRYAGPVCFLIGTGTFSSANMLTNTIKDYQLATLIGEQTAEPANDFGEIFPFMLPHTHIVATGAMKMFTRANGDEKDFTGIQPDIEVKNTLTDIQQKKDRVLERAIEWVMDK